MLFQDRFEGGPLLASCLADLPDPAAIVELILLRGAVPVGYELALSLLSAFREANAVPDTFRVRLAALFGVLIHVDQRHVLQPPETTSQWDRGGEAPDCPWRWESRPMNFYRRKTV